MSTTASSGASASANANDAPPSESSILVREFLAANPQLSSSQLGNVEIMTGRFTNAEWAEQIEETTRGVLSEVGKAEKEGRRKYEVPKVGELEFAKTIDHTLLKLDATAGQIDGLCAEARTEGFKVCGRFCFGLENIPSENLELGRTSEVGMDCMRRDIYTCAQNPPSWTLRSQLQIPDPISYIKARANSF
jgi:hypothetical protein